METKVRKIGNGLGVLFPKNLVKMDEKFEIEQVADKIILIPKRENDFYANAEPLQFRREDEWSGIDRQGAEEW